MRPKPLRGTKILACLLLLASFYKLWGFTDYDYYGFMFQQLSAKMIAFRYGFSIALRLVGIGAGFYLLKNNEKARKVVLALCVLSLVLSPWKHPYKVFENIAILVEASQGFNEYPAQTELTETGYPAFPEDLGNFQLKAPHFPQISLAIYTAIDIIFAVSVLVYFTRPKVKESFAGSTKNE